MKIVKRIALAFGGILVLAIAGFAVYVATHQNVKYDKPFPAISASTDPAVIEQGRYLVRTAASCSGCHGDPARHEDIMKGDETVPLSGAHHWDIPPGHFYSKNLTSDPETGIGKLTDGQLARALREGIGHDGRALLPFMEMQGLADDDLTATISYLRTLPPVKNAVPPHRPNLLGKIVLATLLSKPVGPRETPPAVAPKGLSVERGRYLSEFVVSCYACHTQRDMKTGALVGPRYGGATGFPDEAHPDRLWNPPNITTGVSGKLATLTEDDFVKRMRAGRTVDGSPMPWPEYGRLVEDDVRSIYRFLKTVPAVEAPILAPMTKKS